MRIYTALIAMTGLFAQGSAMAGDEIDKHYHGQYVIAHLKAGEENPTASGCLRTKLGSIVRDMTLNGAGGVFGSINYIDNEECGGENFIKGEFRYDFKNESRTKTEQVLKVPGQYYEITIAGDVTVKKLNEAKVCGYTEWAAKKYIISESPLKDCTFENMGMTIPPFINETDIQNWRTRLSVQGTGIATASKAKPDDDYHHVEYWAPKP